MIETIETLQKQNQEKFNKALTYITRKGKDELVSWLKSSTDFFDAPASTEFHGNYPGGLLEHSLLVLELALYNFNVYIKKKPELEDLRESIVITALFHDLCKVNYYIVDTKWYKDENNAWKSYMGYKVNDQFPLGHGEKSLFYINRFMELTNGEALAIRWHMGALEPGNTIPGMPKYSFDAALNNPLVRIIHTADVLASGLEKTVNNKTNLQ